MKMIFKPTKPTFKDSYFAIALLFVIGCGGGDVEDAPGSVSIPGTPKNSAPVISVTSPISGENQLVEQITSLDGSATDDEDGDLSQNIKWISDIDGDLGIGSHLDVKLSMGAHLITAEIVDSSGLSASSKVTYDVIEANEAPSISIITPSTGSVQNYGEQTSLSAVATDKEDGILSEEIVWDSSIDGPLGVGENRTVQLSVGNHQISAQIKDSAGSTKSAKVSVNILADNQLPSLTILSPSNGSSYQENVLINFSAEANDTEDGDLSNVVQWQSDIDGQIGVGSNISTSLNAGTHRITAIVFDSSNQSRAQSLTLSITERNSIPFISIISPANNSTSPQGSLVNFNATASDNEDGDLSRSIAWQSSIDGNLGTGASINYNLNAGNHVITATVSDSGNLSAVDTLSISVSLDDNSPLISILSPNTGSSELEGSLVFFEAEASDTLDGNLNSQIQWSSNIDGSLGRGPQIGATLSAGNHTIVASVINSTNIRSAATITFQVITQDSAPTINITSPSNGDSQAVNQTTLLTASASDTQYGNLSSSIQWTSDLDGDLGTGSTLSIQLSAGTHLITATIQDLDGEISTDSITFSLVESYGVATLSWNAPTENTDDSELTDLAGFKIYYGLDQLNLSDSITISDPNSINHLFENLQNNQTYYFAVVAFNDAGVESDKSEIVSKLIES